MTGVISINLWHRLVSWAWPKTRMTTQVAIAISRLPTKLRFPQGSEVWITGCPKFVTAAKSGLINPELKAETELPELLPWRLVSGFPRNWSRVLSSERRLAGGSTVYCRHRRSVSSCFFCSASSPAWSAWRELQAQVQAGAERRREVTTFEIRLPARPVDKEPRG